MEELNRCHDEGRFFVQQLEYAAAWKECHVEFCKRGEEGKPTVKLLSGGAALAERLQRGRASGDLVSIYFPGFQVLAIKLLFRRAGTGCPTTLAQHPLSGSLWQASMHPEPGALPLGFSVHLRPKPPGRLTDSELKAKNHFSSLVAPMLGEQDEAATKLVGLLHGLAPGERRFPEGTVPALFDDRPKSRVVSLQWRGVAKSANAPMFVELRQAPPHETPRSKYILVKRGDNPHQDRFALAMARVFNSVWETERIAVSVAGRAELVQHVLYGVLQGGVRTSVIEVLEGCSPVRSFHDRHNRVMMAMFGDAWWQGDLNDWVPSAALLASAAAAFTTSYVLDVGDRHQDNMLVTGDGRLFNIDFSYLFGEHPRVVDAKPFAIPVALRNALVQNGHLWATFKAACVRAFAALAQHREFVIAQAIAAASALGSHFLLTHSVTFGRRLVEPSIEALKTVLGGVGGAAAWPGEPPVNTVDMLADANLEALVRVVGGALSRSIDRGVYGHQVKDAFHERWCVVM